MKYFKVQFFVGLTAVMLLSGCVVDPYYGRDDYAGKSSMSAMGVNSGGVVYPNSPTYYPYSIRGYSANYPVTAYNAVPLNAYSAPAYHIVQPGDTLYKIGKRYGVNYLHISSRNGIPYPYTIWPGQRLVIY